MWPHVVPTRCLRGVRERLDLRRGPLGFAVGGKQPNACRVLFEGLGLLPDLPNGDVRGTYLYRFLKPLRQLYLATILLCSETVSSLTHASPSDVFARRLFASD